MFSAFLLTKPETSATNYLKKLGNMDKVCFCFFLVVIQVHNLIVLQTCRNKDGRLENLLYVTDSDIVLRAKLKEAQFLPCRLWPCSLK